MVGIESLPTFCGGNEFDWVQPKSRDDFLTCGNIGFVSTDFQQLSFQKQNSRDLSIISFDDEKI